MTGWLAYNLDLTKVDGCFWWIIPSRFTQVFSVGRMQPNKATVRGSVSEDPGTFHHLKLILVMDFQGLITSMGISGS